MAISQPGRWDWTASRPIWNSGPAAASILVTSSPYWASPLDVKVAIRHASGPPHSAVQPESGDSNASSAVISPANTIFALVSTER
jgi:hypothetical protein